MDLGFGPVAAMVCCSHTIDCDVWFDFVFFFRIFCHYFQVVFTSSEGLVPHMLTKRSAKSRMGDIIEIGDPTVEHATQYLTCRGVTENISSVLNITGTRFKELDATATALIAGNSLEDRRASLFRDVASELQGLGVSPAPPATRGTKDVAFWGIVNRIVQDGFVSTKFFSDAASIDEDYNILSSCNIFLMDNNKEQVTFQSRPVELYMRAKTGVFEEQCNATTE